MNKKGFTLIELLAVIVILAIIALIATPIVLNIIEDSKDSSKLNSANHYLDAVEQAIMKYNMNNGGNFIPQECKIQSNGNLKCDGKEIVVEIDGETPTSGTITFESGNIVDVQLNYNEAFIVYDENKSLVYGEKPICTLAENGDKDNSGTVTKGDEYLCKVKDTMEEGYEEGYTFYVLSSGENGKTNLIMDNNVNSDGTPCGECSISAWQSSGSNSDGPVDAINALYSATKNWVKVSPLTYTYNDRESQQITTDNVGYTSFVVNNGEAKIISFMGVETTIGTVAEPLRARIIDISEFESLVEFNFGFGGSFYEKNIIWGGYWTLSSSVDTAEGAYALVNRRLGALEFWNEISSKTISETGGIRPVISVKL